MRLRKKLAFINYLLRNGTIRNKISANKVPDKDLLINLKINTPVKSSSLRYRLRKKILQNVIAYNLWAVAAYFKTSLFHHANYIIFEPLHLIYTRVPKAASTFLAYEMMKKLDPNLPSSLPDKQINQVAPYYTNRSIPIDKRDFINFSVVRNPFHRVVAVHREFFHPEQSRDFIYENYLCGILKKNMEFKEFIDVIDLIPDFLKDRHFRPQSSILKEAKKKTKIRIFKLEEQANELQVFLQNYGLSIPKQEENSRSYDYKSYYDMATAQKVRSIYFKDIEDFSYDNIWDDLINAIKLRAANNHVVS